MQRLVFVIGAAASGKSHFIKEHFGDTDAEILDIFDYQQKAYDEAGFGEHIPFSAMRGCLYKANNDLLKDIIGKLKAGRDIIAEHTLFKMKRRLAYIDEIRRAVDVHIIFYVMCPSDERWKENIAARKLGGTFKRYKETSGDIEFPNTAEGIDEIFEVADGEIRPRTDPPKPVELLEAAREELMRETEKMHADDERKQKRKELIESMNVRPFWHYCEVCGKKEYLTAQEAFDSGWDYPPRMGWFGLLSPRTCGSCLIKDTLYWKIQQQSLPIVLEGCLTPEELITWRRIKAEPESLLSEENAVER
ncbi:MAG: ATP-binding protein [Lachnospiraceae bacterium]|nr:ATP-binding protein [Ruminococcus sp.]MCM1276591.1 ATP-binding protein [Lachnospiraceae bacterium]